MKNKLKLFQILFINLFLIVSCGPDVVAPVEVMDTDKDGVNDSIDQCDNTPVNSQVDANGCSVNFDTDNDGVDDQLDQCANTPLGSQVDAQGCVITIDSDNDGVNDSIDQCPNTAAFTNVSNNGCPINVDQDDDLDGVLNNVDQCAQTSTDEVANIQGCSLEQLGAKHYNEQSCALCHGENGLAKADNPAGLTNYPVDICSLTNCNDESILASYIEQTMPTTDPSACTIANQCATAITKFMTKHIVKAPIDSDMDNVFDNVDECLNTPVNSTVDAKGCALSQLDSDNDGVNNQLDICANTPLGTSIDQNGCPLNTGGADNEDDDNDGVINVSDNCKNTSAEFTNTVDQNGCSSYDRGLEYYFAKLGGGKSCADCHGIEGQGATGGGAINAICSDVNCQDKPSLTTYIKNEMPYQSAALCDESNQSSCASDITTFMHENFYKVEGDIDIDGIEDSVDACTDTKATDIPSIDHTGCKNVNLITPVAFAINVGGQEFISRVNGSTFIADNAKYFDNSKGSTQGEKDHEVANTIDDELYHHERWGTALEYTLPVAKGTYTIELHLAEVYHEQVGKRIMQVVIEGDSVLDDYDIYQKTGAKNSAIIETIENVVVSDDALNLNFIGKTDNASIVAIRVLGEKVNDADADGVRDTFDSCPGTMPNSSVSSTGCSDAQLDKDNDNVLLPYDACPETPINQISSVETSGLLAGCSIQEQAMDQDGDGVSDFVDNCPSYVEGDDVGATGCTGDFTLPNFNLVSPQMRLTATEVTNIVKGAFNRNTLPSVTFQGDMKGPFAIFTNNALDDSGDFQTLVESALVLGEELAPDFVDLCDWLGSPGNCVRAHFSEPMKTLYRQNTISDEDVQQIKSVISATIVDEPSEAQAIATGIARILIDDRTAYQFELGLNPKSSGKMLLTNNEFIERLSFALLNDSPDAELRNLENSILNDTQALQGQIDRLMQTDNYKENIWLFVADWLNIPSSAGSDMSNINNAAIEESKRLVFHVVENDLPITEIFTADYSFINSTLAQHYGVNAPNQDWEKVNFSPSDNRKGILTHANFLMKTGGHTRDVNTIFRGKVVFEGMFCEVMAPPPPPEQSTELAGEVSDRGTHNQCAGCHSKVDPIGRMFDQYDNDGKVYEDRVYHGGLYVDVDIANEYDSVPDFVAQIPKSKAFNQCLARQIVRFTLGRDANVQEQASFDQIKMTLDDPNDATFNSAFKALILSDTFKDVHISNENSCSVGNL